MGASHACALTADGEAVCWDIASGAVWDAPPGPYTAITARRGATCAITETGEIVCWSAGGGPFPKDEPDPARDAPPGRYTAFSWDVKWALDRYTYACALTDGSEVVCWSQEGRPVSSEELILPDPPPGAYTALSVRYAFLGWDRHHLTVCALAGTDGAVCRTAGRAHASVFPPSTWFFDGDYASVAVSRRSFCGLAVTGEIEGCGLPQGDGTARYAAVSPGEKHVCAITDAGDLECWVHGSGWFVQGELFVMDPPASSSVGYVAVSVGHGYGCALTEVGEAVCWGVFENKVEWPDAPSDRYVAVSDGGGHTCALTEGGEAVCWGWNNMGQAEAPAGRYQAISAGETGTCALTEAGEMACWGWDTYAHAFTSGPYRTIILSSAGGSPVTCAVTEAGAAACQASGNFLGSVEFEGGPYRSIHVGGGLICALSEDGEMVCRGTGYDDDAPELLADGVVAATDGPGPICVLTEGEEVVCWGATDSWSPDLPHGPYVAVSTGYSHGCALTEAGEAHCWDSFGESGQGQAAPLPGRYTAISAGWTRTCAVTQGGDVVCWGDTGYAEAPSGSPYN